MKTLLVIVGIAAISCLIVGVCVALIETGKEYPDFTAAIPWVVAAMCLTPIGASLASAVK